METMDNKDKDHNYFKTSPRADSFVDINTENDALTDAMDAPFHGDDVAPTTEMDFQPQDDVEDDDDAIIKCICGYGKGYDDDDATSCEKCETWQHNLCYFKTHSRPLPQDSGEHFYCADCAPHLSTHLKPELARAAMRRKLRRLERIADQISELRAELFVRGLETEDLWNQLDECEAECFAHGPELESQRTEEAWAQLDAWHDEWCDVMRGIFHAERESEEIRQRVAELEDDQARVRRNENTVLEELREVLAKVRSTPALWTVAGSLGVRACQPYLLPPVLAGPGAAKNKKKCALSLGVGSVKDSAGPAVGGGKVAKPRKKKRRIGR